MDNAVEGDVDNGRLDQTYYQLEKVTLCPKSAASLEALVNFPQDYVSLSLSFKTRKPFRNVFGSGKGLRILMRKLSTRSRSRSTHNLLAGVVILQI